MNVSYLTNVLILANFEREINKLDDSLTKPATEDSLFWLNQAVSKFTKLRFNGDFTHRTSYEQNDKRRSDLINLYVEAPYTHIASPEDKGDYQEYTFTYPEDFMYALNEDVVITDTQDKNEKHVSVFECTSDSFMYRIMNSLTDFHYKYGYARPLRIRTADYEDGVFAGTQGCKLLTDGKYLIKEYILGYLRFPEKIKLGEDAQEEYTDFNEHTMHEIIKIAAQMYIENQSEQRYKTITNEVMTLE